MRRSLPHKKRIAKKLNEDQYHDEQSLLIPVEPVDDGSRIIHHQNVSISDILSVFFVCNVFDFFTILATF